MSEPYFLVSKYPNDNDPKEIGFTPINKGLIPKDYLLFKSDVETLISTITVLFNNDKKVWLQFYEEIYFAASLCFLGDKSDFITASQTINEIKDKLTSLYWSRIRNIILIKYGFSILIISTLLLILFLLVDKKYEFYFISLIGACIGSWLSLAIRTKQLIFEDIRSHISEVSSPYIRCIFVCTLCFTFILLFKLGFIEIKLGDISSKDIATNLEVSLALGVLFGFGEKFLISTINDKTKQMFK